MSEAYKNTTDSPNLLHIPVDAEHSRMRTAGCLVVIVMMVVGYFLLNALLPVEGFNFLAALGGLIFGAVVGWGAERYMRSNWPSGRAVEASPNLIRVQNHSHTERSIDPTQHVNVLMWRFAPKKHPRVPRGWYLIACALEQDETYLAVYAIIAPEAFQTLQMAPRFEALMSQRELKAGEKERDLRMAGQQRRLQIAEQERLMHGAEMTAEQFGTYLDYLKANFPRWLPSA